MDLSYNKFNGVLPIKYLSSFSQLAVEYVKFMTLAIVQKLIIFSYVSNSVSKFQFYPIFRPYYPSVICTRNLYCVNSVFKRIK